MPVAELSDEKIMLKVKEGNLSELTELFDRYHVKLYNFFLKLTFDKAASDDLTQNLFYRVIKYRQTFKFEEGAFRPWVYQMARNVHFDFCKEHKKQTGNLKMVDDYKEDIAGGDGEYSEEHLERLDRALLQLMPEQREMIVLSRYQGLKYSEISRIKDISVPAIKVQVHRAMKQLRSIYFKQS